jgi:TPP-dependent pyruvate/acetoin dehydrogenase alpha subunit
MTANELTAFESNIKTLWEQGELPCLLHLAGGNEEQLIKIFKLIGTSDWIFSTHRTHFHALLKGVSPAIVEEKIREGRSMFLYFRDYNFFSNAILAGAAPIAAGVAWALKQEGSSARVWCFQSDGSEENGHLYEAALFVEANQLPCTFIIEDNGRQVDTPKAVRRGAYTKGLEDLFKCVTRYTYTPTYPHAGSGCTFQIKFKPEAVERLRPK